MILLHNYFGKGVGLHLCLLLIIQFKIANMVEQSQLLNEIKKLEASARQYQQEVSVLTTLQTHTNLTTNH